VYADVTEDRADRRILMRLTAAEAAFCQ